jgi:two-component system chemotaxis response regulator CheB
MTDCELVIIGASWGGLQAVGCVLGGLPRDFGIPVLVVQHRAEDAGDLLPWLLGRAGPLPVREVEDKQPLAGARVLVAPAGYHVLVEADHLALSTDAQVGFSRPSIDVAFETAAHALGPAVVGVVLTGDNSDGAAGLAAVRRRGGFAIVQDPETAVRPAMPTAALAARPQVVAPLDEIPALLVRLTRTGEVVR